MSGFSSGWDVIKWAIQGPMSKMKRALMCVIYKINHEDAKDVMSMQAIMSLDLLLNIEIYIYSNPKHKASIALALFNILTCCLYSAWYAG
ncbi:MAG: hypothetical protein ACI936_000101 [Paraglaciecola sp.]|jgi:hypothetical protein